jgi:pimeloyl-ACP methyl ester carboxylesterase
VLVPAFTWGIALWLLIAVTAFVASLRVAPLQALVTEIVTPDERPTYIALRNGASQLGIATSVAAAGWLYVRMGYMGIGLLCAGLSLVAWASLRRIEDPHDAAREHAESPRARRPWVRRIAVGTLGTVVFLAIALPWSLSFLVTKARTRPDERNLTVTPATYNVAYEDVSFRSVDGNHLSGWFMPGGNLGITIVMTHGLFRSRFELIHRATDLAQLGYSVLVYDLRRHGQSDGEFCTIGYEERRDVEAALAFVRERAPGNRIVLYGVSMGAAATLLAAAESRDIAAVVADSSFLSLQHTVYHHLALAHIPVYPFAPMLVWFTSLRMSYLPGQFDVVNAVRRTPCPILFIGGTKDVRMPVESVLEPLYDAAPSPLKEKLVVDEATHGHAYDENPSLYVATVNTFLQKALADTAHR